MNKDSICQVRGGRQRCEKKEKEILKMTELQTALNGGVQIVPEWTEQVVFLDFGGAQTSYNGEILTLDDVNVENSGLTASRIAEITVRLNAEYAKRGIRFVTTEPISGEYSTIYIGKTSAFDSYGSFNGLAETIDSGNKNRTDKAFVNLDSFSSDDTIVNTIDHELGHITGTLVHDGEGLDAYGHKPATLSNAVFIPTKDTNVWKFGSMGYPYCSCSSDNILHLKDATISAGATVMLFSATAEGTKVMFGGSDVITTYGSEIGTIIFNGGTQVVCGTVSNAIVKSGGHQYLSGGYYSGYAYDTTVESGGTQTLDYRCYGIGTVVKSGGLQLVNAFATASNTKIEHGAVQILGGISGYVFKAEDYDAKVYGLQQIGSSSYVSNATIYAGGTQFVSGGIASNTIILSGGRVNAASSATIRHLNVSYGGIFSAADSSVNVTLNVYEGGKAYGGWIKYASIESGGALYEGYIGNYGSAYILSGGSAYGTTVEFRASMYVSSGAKTGGLVVNRLGELYVSSGAVAAYTKVNASGNLNLYGSATDMFVDGGYVSAFKGSVINGLFTTSSQGGVSIYSGAVLTGEMHLYSTVYLKNCTVDFNIANHTEESKAVLNNWGNISGYLTAQITVSASQAQGKYSIADKAADMNQKLSFTVYNTLGSKLGTLTVGSSFESANKTYALGLNDSGTLYLTVERFGKPASSDIDGNGVSDVMFQYKVDHQIGFWMNGSNTWKGQGLPEPAEWEVVGAYDMNANGKADVVMLGNVTVNGVKGAYVGYRKDGDMSTWENISFLNNPDNIQWTVKVGNMTGNAGKNSIVWHAAELGAVGVWTDGTDNWVSISGGFDKNWTMLGTGDFNGDGKDEILFRNGTNFYTTDINSNFSSLGGFGDGWDVRAIGDFSGDGKDDLVLFHKDTGSVVKLENGQTSSYASLGQLDANDWFIVGAGDYNGDGKDDLLVRQYSSGMLGYYANGDFSKWNEMGRGVDMNWAVIA